MTIVQRNSFGQFLPGSSANPQGRLPRQTEAKYLDVTMAEVTTEQWAEVVRAALMDALGQNEELAPRDKAYVAARAREWLAKYLIGEPSQLQQLLYREERSFEIVVRFGDDDGNPKRLSDTVDADFVSMED